MRAPRGGAFWYIAGIGDALVYRERMQEAADSVSFSAAIVEARGMNIIVMINLLMAAILAIRVAINMLKGLCTVLAAVFWGISLIPFCEWAAAPAETSDHGRGEKNLYQILDSGTSARNAIDNRARRRWNVAWTAIQKTPPPPSPTRRRSRWRTGANQPAPSRYAESLPLSGDLPPMAFTLPVEDGSLDKLCSKAGEAVGGSSRRSRAATASGAFSEGPSRGWPALRRAISRAPGASGDAARPVRRRLRHRRARHESGLRPWPTRRRTTTTTWSLRRQRGGHRERPDPDEQPGRPVQQQRLRGTITSHASSTTALSFDPKESWTASTAMQLIAAHDAGIHMGRSRSLIFAPNDFAIRCMAARKTMGKPKSHAIAAP